MTSLLALRTPVGLGPRSEGGPSALAFPEAWHWLNQEISTCRRCALHRTRLQVVIYRGPPSPRVLFVGEAPGAREDLLGLPFVGRAGARLDGAIRRLGLRRSEVGVLNLIKCHPPRNKFDPEAARACLPFLERQIALLRPSLIVTLGARALAVFDRAAPPISESSGRFRRWKDLPFFPMLHPAATFRSGRFREQFDHDVETLGVALSGRTLPDDRDL